MALALKHSFDFIAAVVISGFLFPAFLLISLAIKLDSRGPVFFKQLRAGLRGKSFWIYKFRSMTFNARRSGSNRGKEDIVVTGVGRWLRSTSLDELPQLINVLTGEMSLVGPRPLFMNSIRPEERRRLEFKPGITGLAAINDNVFLSWDQRMALDLWYIDNWMFWLDFHILLKTIPVALNRKILYDPERES